MALITTTALAAAIGAGLTQIGGKVLDKGVLDPALEPLNKFIGQKLTRPLRKKQKDKGLQEAVEKALETLDLPTASDNIADYALQLGFDKLLADGSDALRMAIAEAALLQTTTDPQSVPLDLIAMLRVSHDSRPALAQFLYALRAELQKQKGWQHLVAYSDNEAIRDYLRQTATAVQASETYLRLLVEQAGINIVTDKEALATYVNHVASRHRTISFLFVKPLGQKRNQLISEAELETVFVSLQVQDPDRPQERYQADLLGGRQKGDEGGKETTLTINQVLARFPVFLLLGNPGSGKTTLLRHLALSFARGEAQRKLDWQGEPLLPILVPLRNFGRFWRDNSHNYTGPVPSALREFIAEHFREHELALSPNFFRKRLAGGNCLVLLDGLDEVADRDMRATVAQVVSKFIEHYGKLGNRFGLASRPKGYEEVQDYLPKPMVCTVQDMDQASRDELVGNLLKQFSDTRPRWRKEQQKLVSEIQRKRRVEELSRNPLFCTTLVLVYKYRGASLPERRVDVYKELVDLMLGFWDVHRFAREDVADVRELALMDGTGRIFESEERAVEAKREALIKLAYWMQEQNKAEVSKPDAETYLAVYFEDEEGAEATESEAWARGFLNIAHQRSGLFVEAEPGKYAFSHQNFREYLAATAVVDFTDDEMLTAIIDHAEDSWWREVILLAVAHERLSNKRRKLLLEALLKAGRVVLVGECAIDAGGRLPHPTRKLIVDQLYTQMVDDKCESQVRFEAGKTLDGLGWLPSDMNQWVPCEGCGEAGETVLVMKYPVTSAQFALFMAAGGYENPSYWGGEDSQGWRWRLSEHNDWRGKGPVTEPEYWQGAEYGKQRRGFPVVGVSWYEGTAYGRWLTDVLARLLAGDESVTAEERDLVADLVEAGARQVRLPTEAVWECVAGGGDNERYPWDTPNRPVTNNKADIAKRANVSENNVNGTTPVGMHPQGASDPFGVWDLAGNMWEWTDSWYDTGERRRVLRGGSWDLNSEYARAGVRYYFHPDFSDDHIGFRLVSPIILLNSGS